MKMKHIYPVLFDTDATLWTQYIKDYNVPLQMTSVDHCKYAFVNFDWFLKYLLTMQFANDCIFELHDGNTQEFININKQATSRCIDVIEQLDSYRKFNEMELPKHDEKLFDGIQFSKGLDIYKQHNDGKKFVSIDLTAANLQSMNYFEALSGLTNISKFPHTKTIDFQGILNRAGEVGDYRRLKYLAMSKRIRQIIFGNLNPKRQQAAERYITEELILRLLDTELTNLKPEDFYGYTTDEIILNYTDKVAELFDGMHNTVTKLNEGRKYIDVHVESFELKQLKPYDFWVKLSNRYGTVSDIKKVPVVYFLQVLRYLNDESVQPEDMEFLYEANVARFVQPLWK